MNRIFLLFIMSLLVCYQATCQTQAECEDIMRKADSAIGERNYNFALTKLRAYKICSPATANKADEKILTVFNRIEAERKEADSAKDVAVKQTAIAELQKKAARQAQTAAERQAYLARLSALSANSMLLARQDPTLAFRLAAHAYLENPSREHSGVIQSIISDTANSFYKFNIEGYYSSYAFNDETKLMYCTNGLELRRFSQDGQLQQVRRFDMEEANCLSISPTGKYTFLSSANKLMIYRNDDFTYQSKSWSGPWFSEARWSNDGAYIYLSNLYQGHVYVLDSNLNTVFQIAEKNIMSFDFAPDLEYFAIAYLDAVIVRDTAEGSVLDTIPEGASIVRFNRNGRRLYTSSMPGGEIKIWSRDDDTLVSTKFEGHVTKVTSINFGSPGYYGPTERDTVLSSSDDGVNILWVSDGRVIKVCRNVPGGIYDAKVAALSSRYQHVITATVNGLYLWQSQNNPLGTIGTMYPRMVLSDFSQEVKILHDLGTAYYLKTAWTTDTFKISIEDPITDMYLLDPAGDRLLLKYNDRAMFINRRQKTEKLLIRNGSQLLWSYVDRFGNILLYLGKTVSLFDNNGTLRLQTTLGSFPHSLFIAEGTDLYSVTADRVYLIDAKRDDTLRTWSIPDPFRSDVVDKLAISPNGDYILAGTARGAFLFDTAWRLIKRYDIDYWKAGFSPTGDSIYFSTYSGVNIRYSFTGLLNSREISPLSIRENLRYDVPGFLQKIVAKRSWHEYDLCVHYLYIDYLSSENESNITRLDYLYAQSDRFYSFNKPYYLELDSRIAWYDDILKDVRVNGMLALKGRLTKIRNKLATEKRLLAAKFGRQVKTERRNKAI